jgi:hypothetical protein
MFTPNMQKSMRVESMENLNRSNDVILVLILMMKLNYYVECFW